MDINTNEAGDHPPPADPALAQYHPNYRQLGRPDGASPPDVVKAAEAGLAQPNQHGQTSAYNQPPGYSQTQSYGPSTSHSGNTSTAVAGNSTFTGHGPQTQPMAGYGGPPPPMAGFVRPAPYGAQQPQHSAQPPPYGAQPAPYGAQPAPYGAQHGYGQPQPHYGYAGQQSAVTNNTTVVMQTQPTVVTVPQSGGRTSTCLVCSILNCIFCNFTVFVGILAIVFSCKAQDDFDKGRNVSGRSNANVAKGLNICMPITSVLIACAAGAYIYFTFFWLWEDYGRNGGYDYDTTTSNWWNWNNPPTTPWWQNWNNPPTTQWWQRVPTTPRSWWPWQATTTSCNFWCNWGK